MFMSAARGRAGLRSLLKLDAALLQSGYPGRWDDPEKLSDRPAPARVHRTPD
jgi:hypothetical protein